MNRTNFVQTGGFGVKCERLQELQTAYAIFNQLGFLAGQFAILSGCEVIGTSVSDGYVFMNGEVLPFNAGTLAQDVIIIEVPISKEFENGEVKQVHFIRYATFGTSADMASWSDFKRVDPIITLMARLTVLEKKTAVFQSGGGMVHWNKPANQIPTGWQEVVNWRGRIPVGMDVTQTEFNTLGKQGGDKIRSLTSNNVPAPTTNAIKFQETPPTGFGIKTGTNVWVAPATNNGGNVPFSILNPYRTVLFIEYIG